MNNTRKEIEKEYQVRDGLIVTPGKFEGQPIYVPYYYGAYLDGFADFENGRGAIGFYVTAVDKEQFPELKRRRTVKLIVRESGFVEEV